MSEKILASLLSENSNESCTQTKKHDIENEELSSIALVTKKSDVNGISKEEQTQDLIDSPVKETDTSDRNGNYNDLNGKEEEDKSLTVTAVVPTEKIGIDEECNNQTEVEVTIIKEIHNELHSLNTSSSSKVMDSKLESTMNPQKYRDDLDSSDDDSSSTFSLGSSSDCSDSFLDKMHRSATPCSKIPHIKTKGELDLDDLPPIEDLHIDVTETEMKKVGTIHAIVDKLVIVRALKDLQPLDLDSVLFLSYQNPLGRVFDVFGPVVEPFYAIRFNSPKHIDDKKIIVNSDVFFAPEKTEITTYVFVDQLKKQKGSDASWQDNNEPPSEYLDYSDDEEERIAKRKRQAKNRHRRLEIDLESEDDANDVQVIPNKFPRGSNRKDAEKTNPFRRPYPPSEGSSTITYTRPSMADVMTSKYTPRRYGSRESLSSLSTRYGSWESLASTAPHQNSPLQSPSPSVMSSASYPIFSQPPPPLRPQSHYTPIPSQSPLTMMPTQSPTMPPQSFMYQQQQPFVFHHPGMSPNPVFGQVPYFNQGLQSPMGVPPPPTTPAPFVSGNQSQNFTNPPPNFSSQASHFGNPPPNFASQASHFVNPNFTAMQASAQWQQGPPSPYGMTPLSITIPSTPPPNVIPAQIPSYNNPPPSRYFNNMQ